MSRFMLLLLALLAVAFAGLTGLAIHKGVLNAPSEQSSPIGGPFQLVDQKGRSVDERGLEDKWSAVFFGFTQCPDACPTTLFALAQAEKLLGNRARDFQTVFITVDPERDTPPVVATYLSNDAFPKQVVGLTGTPAQVARVTQAYHVFAQKEGTADAYTVNHTTITYLMGPTGKFVCVIPFGATPEVMAQKITAAMKAGPKAQSC